MSVVQFRPWAPKTNETSKRYCRLIGKCNRSGVSLSVNVGEVVGLIGDDGAGRSPLIKVLAGSLLRRVAGFSSAASRCPGGTRRVCAVGIETVFQDRTLAVQSSRPMKMLRTIDCFGFLKISEGHRSRQLQGRRRDCPRRADDSAFAHRNG